MAPRAIVLLFLLCLVGAVGCAATATRRMTNPDTAAKSAVDYDDTNHLLTVRPSSAESFVIGCTDFIRVFKTAGGVREELVSRADDQRDGQVGGYYLSGRYLPCVMDLGCDVLACQFNRELTHTTLELVRTGAQSLTPADAPAWTTGCGKRSEDTVATAVIPVFEERPYHGPVEIEVTYFTDSDCGGSPEPGASPRGVVEVIPFVIP